MTTPTATAFNMPTVRRCAAPITERTGVHLAAMCVHNKSRKVSRARWDLWASLVLIEGWPMWSTAKRFGFDHTSVLYGLRTRSAELHGTRKRASLEEMRAAEILSLRQGEAA